jgi:4-diphosphocytidyl-2-C-methyl-D-erythritol kinase
VISEAASAKINLFLHVGERRDDGFHPLQSLAVFTDMGDMLTLEKDAPGVVLVSVAGPFAAGLQAESDNLVLRAALSLIEKEWGSGPPGAKITLTKNLPVASGIGGGSADAAATLRGLRRFWNLQTDDIVLQAIAAELGSDVPVCLANAPSFMEGRGEILRPLLSLPRVPMLLVNPGVAVPTKDVFAALADRSGAGMQLPQGRFQDTADLLRFLETTRNDLEEPARRLQPVIGEVLAALAALPGALLSRMSGSGATCFAIFADDDCCERAAQMLRDKAPGWWIAPTFVPEAGLVHENEGQDIGPTDGGL